jgi:hypothetical protein
MTEDEFWGRMEYRIADELSGMEGHELRKMWCDGIIGGVDHLDDHHIRLSGTVCLGPDGQTEMTFVMALPSNFVIGSDIPWDALLPADHLTGWLAVDAKRKRVSIDINKAEPMASHIS